MVVGHDHVQRRLGAAVQRVEVRGQFAVVRRGEGQGGGGRGDEDDAFPALRGGVLDERGEGRGEGGGAEEVGVVDCLVLAAQGGGRGGGGDAGVVDELGCVSFAAASGTISGGRAAAYDVQPPELVLHRLHGLLDGVVGVDVHR